MTNCYFISDLHLGHKNILDFCPDRGGTNVDEHSEWLVEQWNSTITKRDVVWVLGDICFDKKHLRYLKQMNGQKHMIYGNHDTFSLPTYQPYFNTIRGFTKKSGLWLSHAPIHPYELRGRVNVHGHVHQHTVQKYYIGSDGNEHRIDDPSYINVCVDVLKGKPIHIDEIRTRIE
jgi:calcineurin-like phosphoesterase family protein